jgi:hypothetical protein
MPAFKFIATIILAAALALNALPVAAHFRLASHGGQGSGGGATNVISVQLGNENLPVSAASGHVIGPLTAKVTGGGACVGCTFSMVNSGASSDGSVPISCSASSNDFQVITSGPDPVDLANLNVISTAQIYGQADPASPTHSYICVKATPPVGASFTQPFSIMVRNPTFTAFGPLFVQYTTGVGETVPLSTTICWTHCGGAGSPPAVTYTLGADAACTASGISISGSNLIFSSSYTVPNAGAGGANCHITATAAGVGTGMIGTSGSSFVADVHISQGAYVGPGDATYPNGATGMTWPVWTGPYAISAAYATAGNPIWLVQREGDGQFFTINALTNGDMDYNTLASDCDTSICYLNLAYDQSGNSPGCIVTAPTNCMPTWGQATGAGITTRKPVIFFDAFDGTRVSPTNSNSTDRGMWNPTAYNGSGTTGTLWIDAEENTGVFGGPVVALNSSNGVSNPIAQLSFTNGGGSSCYVGPGAGGGGTISESTAAGGVLHSMICTLNGSTTNGSTLKIDGTETTGTLLNASLKIPLGFGMTYGGGSDQGFIPGPSAVSSTVASSSQRQALCLFDQWTYGISGTC